MSDSTVVFEGCWAVRNLAYNHDGNKAKLSDATVCALLVAALNRHKAHAGERV